MILGNATADRLRFGCSGGKTANVSNASAAQRVPKSNIQYAAFVDWPRYLESRRVTFPGIRLAVSIE